MRIIHINDYEYMAGAETAVQMLRESHQRKGHQTYLFTAKQIGGPLSSENLKRKRLKKIFKSLKPDLIHLHNNTIIGSAPLFLANKLEIPVVWTLHDYRILCKNTLLFRKNGTVCSNNQDCCICNDFSSVTNFSIDEIRKINNNITFIVASDYVKERFSPILQAERIYWDVDENLLNKKTAFPINKKILFGGRKDTEKGLHFVMGAFKKILKTHPESKLVFAGVSRDPDPENVKNIAKIYDVENHIEETGYLQKQQYLDLVESTGLVICASIWAEPFNLTLLESMALGKTLIASNIGGQTEVIGDAGVLVSPKSSTDIAEAVKYLFDNESEAIKLAKKARETAAKFRGGSNKYLSIYQKLL